MTSPSSCFPSHANEIPAQKRGLTGASYTTTVRPNYYALGWERKEDRKPCDKRDNNFVWKTFRQIKPSFEQIFL